MPGYAGSRTKLKRECRRCGQREVARISRQGFFRRRVWPIFGLYPWQCAICGKEILRASRGRAAVEPVQEPRDGHGAAA